MSIKFMAWVWDEGPSDKAEAFLLLALADYSNDEGECWPAVASLAHKCRMSERGIQTVIRRLVDGGWLEIEAGGGRKNCNLYRIKNPAGNAPRRKCTPQMSAETPQMNAKTPQMSAENPAPAAPEPSRTIKEPLIEPPLSPTAKKRRACSLPDGWVPSEKNIQDALSKNFTTTEIENEAESFRDYHLAKGSTFKDWDAAWRTWLRNSRKFGASAPRRRTDSAEKLQRTIGAAAAGTSREDWG